MNADTVRKNYKKYWSDYLTWEKKDHATEHMVYPNNLTESIAIDELTLSKGELYTYLTAKDKGQKKGTLIASIRGTKSEDIIKHCKEIPESERKKVKEVSLDMAATMKLAASTLFPLASMVIDRFHVVKLVLEALQSVRIEYRWEAIALENREIANCKKKKIKFEPVKLSNGETRRELLARSRFLLFRLPSAWTSTQKERAQILFREYPKLREAYRKVVQFRKIYQQQSKLKAKAKFKKWIREIKLLKRDEFNSAANSIQYHLEDILNFFTNRTTNAHAESFNAKIKLYRANLRGVSNTRFFLFRLEKLFS